jgi:hypothetical protein
LAKSVRVDVVADVAQYERALRKAAADTKKFERAVSRSTREAQASTGAFKGLGKTITATAAGFFAFQSGTEILSGAVNALRTSISAARDAQVTQRQLATQLADVGVQFGVVQDKIEKSNSALSKLSGFNVDELEQSLTLLVRSTGDVNASLKLNQVAVNVARGTHKSLTVAANALAKAYNGQTGALKRLGVTLPPNVKGMRAITFVAQKFAGQAAASTTSTQSFQGSLHDVEITIGTALLPLMDKLAKKATEVTDSFNKFAEKAKQPGTPQHTEVSNLRALGTAFGFVAGQIDKAVGAAGGWMQVLPGLKQLSGAGSLLSLFGVSGGSNVPPPHSDVGFRDPDLTARLKRAADQQQARKALSVKQRNAWFDAMIGRLQLRAGVTTDLDKQLAIYREIAAKLQARIKVTNDITRLHKLEDEALQVQAQIAADVAQKRQQAMENLLGGADIALLQADLTKGLTDNLAALELQRQLIVKAIQKYGATKELQLKLIQNQIDSQGLHEQMAEQAREAAEQARQEKIGWMEFAYERAQATKTVADDLKRAKALLAYWQKQAATGKRTLEEAQQVWHWQQEIANLRKKSDDQFAKFKPVDASKFVAGLGLNLTPAQTRNLIGAVAGISRGGKLPPSRTAAFAGAGGVTIHNANFYGVQNIKQLEEESLKRAKARPQPRRGAR